MRILLSCVAHLRCAREATCPRGASQIVGSDYFFAPS